MEKRRRKRLITASSITCCYVVLNYIGKRKKNREGIDKKNTYLSGEGRASDGKKTEEPFYEKYIKPFIDKLLSFIGLLILVPLYVLISFVIFIDDPGPVLFTQKRVGKGKHFFLLHKFRSMKMLTPHDVPTHQLENPEQYITRVGKFLRKYSLDELPQVWDIFVGNMSIIGPRPALWNQEDLVGERDKYDANSVLPGLTGWAQINGRDELEIADKARLDGEYAEHLRQGGIRALFFDVRCFVGTLKSVAGRDGVVEGGTGALRDRGGIMEGGTGVLGDRDRTGKGRTLASERGSRRKSRDFVEPVDPADAGFEDYGYKKSFHINRKKHRRVLITGAGSYIGESFAAYAKERYKDNFSIDTVDMTDGRWRETDFSGYDVVFHVAGIVHESARNADEELKRKYYAVNTDLAIEVAGLAKRAGVRQFIFMSSMSIYGEAAPYGREKRIDEFTFPAPADFYGDSKWQADREIRKLGSGTFHVAVLRPPMIYGCGCKGNFIKLEKLARKLPLFPAVENQHSMLYIDNLSEFLCLLMLSEESGIYFPQNTEYSNTAAMVKKIAATAGHPIRVTKLLNWAVVAAAYVPGRLGRTVNKAFGDNIYVQRLSTYNGLDYCMNDLQTSIELTEMNKQW